MSSARAKPSVLAVCRRGLLIAGLFSLALNVLMLSVPLYMTAVYDRVFSSHSVETLLVLTLLAVGILGVVAVLESVRQQVLSRTGLRLETELGARALHGSLSDRGAADIQGLRDLGQLRQFISSPLVSALFDLPVAPFYLALLFVIHPDLGWIALVAAILLFAVSLANQKLTQTQLADAAQHSLAALSKAQAQARNAEVVRAMGMFENCVASWGGANALALNASEGAGNRNAIFTGLTRYLRLLLQIAMLGYGAWLVLADNSVSPGIVFAASIISARALAPLDQTVGGWKSLIGTMQAWRRLETLLAATGIAAPRTALPDPRPSLSAERLVYAPSRDADPIIKGVSFAIEPGEVVGIIGPSGAGKSTLARLLVGALKPTAGVVRIGGDDISHWAGEALGPFIGYLPQDVELFPATVAENIARLSAFPDDRKVVDAARRANCHQLIQRLPRGYDTLVGPGGQALSGGQRQRIALARAFYGHPRIVVLDEPNSFLDDEGEQALISALMEAQSAGITCLVVTQRTAILPALTKVMVLKGGRVEALGRRDDILKQQFRPAFAGARSVTAAATSDSRQNPGMSRAGTAA